MKKNLLNQNNPGHPGPTKTVKRIGKLFTQWMVLIMSPAFAGLLFTGQTNAQGTWTPVTQLAPDFNNGVMLLMADGTVICHTSSGGYMGDGTIFDRLTPDSTGSYINGTWSQIAPMNRERYAFSSALLKDGRVYAAGGEYGTDGTQNGWHGEVYDPSTDTWTEATGTNANNVISDGNCKILENGNVLQALVDVPFPVHTKVYNPGTNAYTSSPSTLNGQNESMWLKLPDNSVLFVDEGAQTSERYIPSLNQWVADGNVPVALYDPYGLECGPGFLLPDGSAFFIGGTGHTAYYTPSGSNSPGTWAAGPDVPSGRGMPDAPGAMMVNGKILFACSDAPTFYVEFAMPTYFYEFDYLTGTYTQINAPAGGISVDAWSQQCNMLDLPDGSVLFGLNQDATSDQYYIYTPDGTPLAAGKPVIADVTPLTCTTYRITGTGFNGISEGSAFGDENENDSNYPIIRLTLGGKVYYASSYNWNSTGVQRGNAPDTAYFSLSNTIPNGVYSLFVVANGIASDSVAFEDSIPLLSSSQTPPAVCTGTSFTYIPTSNTIGATFTWTRAAVAGISNAAITTPQTTNPNEVLINTAGVPVTVVYAYTIADSVCSNPENVSVVVNPPPIVSFTANTTTSCQLPDSVSFTNTTTAGGIYIWHFGDGDTSTAVNPSHLYLTAGSFTVKLVTISACGIDSMTLTNYIVINPPAAPTATSPVDIACGDIATLLATGSDTLKWYNQPIGGTLLGTGGTYITPSLNSNTTFYVESDVAPASDFCPPATNTAVGAGSTFTNSNPHGEVFTVNQPCTLVSVRVYATGAGNRTINLLNSFQLVINTTTVNIPNGTSTITLNFPFTVGTGYTLSCGDNYNATNLYRNTDGAAYPYNDPGGYVTITDNDIPDEVHYYYFYNWELRGPSCVSARTPVDVVISGGPVASFTYSQNVNVVTFTNTSIGSSSWLWNFGDGNTSSLQNPVHTYNDTGTYIATLTAFNGGCFDTITQTVTILATGINSADSFEADALSIFPNPTNGLLTISVSSNTAEQIQVIVTNTIGEIIYKTMPVIASNQLFNLNLQHSPKGIYFVQLKTNNGCVVRKLVLN